MPPFRNSVTSALSHFPPKDCGGALGAGRAGGVAHGGQAGVLGEGAIWANLGLGLSCGRSGLHWVLLVWVSVLVLSLLFVVPAMYGLGKSCPISAKIRYHKTPKMSRGAG